MNQLFLNALLNGNREILKRFSKIIALWVRAELEDLHSEGEISQATMAKLNPLVRHAIYNSLFALAHWDKSVEAREMIKWYDKSIPDYWEDPVLIEMLSKAIPEDMNWQKPKFNSDFLTEQMELGNICFDTKRNGIIILSTSQLKSDKSKSLREKIRASLKKEGYIYNYGGDLYIPNELKFNRTENSDGL